MKIYHVAGTISAANSTRYSPYLLSFENDGSGAFINSTKTFPGAWNIKDDTLHFTTSDREKWLRFALKDGLLSSAAYEVRFYKPDGTYEPAAVTYTATGVLAKTPVTNQLAGNSYTGNQYKMGTEGVYMSNYTYAFNKDSLYGSGSGNVNSAGFRYELLKNLAFRSNRTGVKEFGVLINGKLVVFKESGVYYWGTYEK